MRFVSWPFFVFMLARRLCHVVGFLEHVLLELSFFNADLLLGAVR